MALEIKNIYGIICLKGKVSNTHVQEVKGHFEALLSVKDSVIVNLCEVKKGKKKLTRVLDAIAQLLPEEQSLKYYSFAEPAVKELYAQLNNPSNFYQAA